MTREQIEARLEELDAQRLSAKEEGQRLQAQLTELLRDEQAETWGLTVEEYAAAKHEADAHRRAEHALHACEVAIWKAQLRSEDARFSEADRRLAASEADRLNASRPALQAAFEKLRSEAKPLHVHLNRARSRARKAARQAQTAVASPASVGAVAKST